MLASLLFLIDLFGRPVTINFAGRNKFNSKFGGMCSLLFFGFLAWAIYNGSIDLFARENPTIINSETFRENPKEMTLTSETFPVGVFVNGPDTMNYRTFIDESIYTVDFIYTRMSTTTLEDGSEVQDYAEIPLVKEICTPSHFGEMADSFPKLQSDPGYCIAQEQPEVDSIRIQGVYASPVCEYLVVKVTQCNNETSPIPCASNETMASYLKGGFFNLLYVDMSVNPNNFSRPDARYRGSYAAIFSPASYKELALKLSHVSVTTDAGWIIAEPKVKQYAKVDSIVESVQIDPHPDKILYACFIQMSQLESHCSRVYKKIQNVLAEVGGLANVALALILVVTTPYLNLKFRESLINELFDINPPLVAKNSKKTNKKGKKKPHQQTAVRTTTHVQENPTYQRRLGPSILGGQNDDIKVKVKTTMNQTRGSPLLKRSLFSSSDFSEGKEKGNTNWDSAKTKKNSLSLSLKTAPSQQKPPTSYFKRIATTFYEDQYINKNKKPLSDSSHDLEADSKPQIQQQQKVQSSKLIDINLELPIKSTDSFRHPLSSSPRKSVKLSQKIVDKKDYDDDLSAIFSEDAFSDTCLDKNSSKIPHAEENLTPYADYYEKELREEGIGEEARVAPSLRDTGKKLTIKNTNNVKQVEGDLSSYLDDYEREPREDFGDKARVRPSLQDMVRKVVRNNIKNRNSRTNSTSNNKEPYRISVSIWEYLSSFFYQSESLRQKMKILSEGMSKIDARLDVVTILRKFREIDKLKAMLFDHDQVVLFDNLPKPELGPKPFRRIVEDATHSRELIRKFSLREERGTTNMILDVQAKIERKEKKSKLDKRFIDVFKEKN